MPDHHPLRAPFEAAIRAEREGQRLYREAAQRVGDPEPRAAFLHLAGEEAQHEAWLRGQLESLTAEGVLDPTLPLGEHLHSPELPLFSDQFLDRAGRAAYEITALAAGIALEEEGARAYRQLAARADLADLRQTFLDLAAWEEGHQTLLRHAMERARERFWAGDRAAKER
ncbi:MAG: ferritin family protein [Deltaproteobacteria bacterium]|nr:ferritin family protein [Deltaproteobacteria bacterium]